MSKAIYFRETWLWLNLLTKDVGNNDIVEVSTVGNTKRDEDVARKMRDSYPSGFGGMNRHKIANSIFLY